MADEACPRRVAVGVRLAAVILAVGVAYHFSLATLAADWRHDTPLADLVLVPPLGALLLLAASRRHRYVASLKLGRLDLLIATALTFAALGLVAAGPTVWSKYFWAMRLDLLTLPLFAGAAVVLLFGSRALVPFAFPLAFLLLAWPLPYLAFLEHALGGFTNATAATVAQIAPRAGLAAAVPGSEESRYVVVHGGDQIVISVASACSGVNALVGFAVVGLAALWLVRGRLVLRLAWFVAGAALVWCLNIVRILGVFVVAREFGEHAAFELLHPVAGIVALNVAFLLLLWLLPLFGLRIRALGEEDEIVDTPLAVAAPRTEQATLRRTAARLVLLVGAAGALALANGQLESAASGFDNTGRPALAAFVDKPATGAGWSIRRVEKISWATPYYGRDSTWIRYRVRPEGQRAVPGRFTTWVDAIVSPDLGAVNAYNLAHCYSFHDFRIETARRVELGGGVVGQLFVYRTPRGVWHALAWQWPVLRRGGEVEHERIVLLASGRSRLQAPPERSGSVASKLLALLNLGAPNVDPNPTLARALAGLGSDMIESRLSAEGEA